MSEPIHIISLGAGVQSSAMALMAAAGEITPMPKYAIFADTQAEPRSLSTIDPATGKIIAGGVYGWLDWLEKKLPFPIIKVTNGDLMKDGATVVTSRKGRKYIKGEIPAFVKMTGTERRCTECGFRVAAEDSECYECGGKGFYEKGESGTVGLLGRRCTQKYKIIPIQREIKRLSGVARGGKEVLAIVWIGISSDEWTRAKPSHAPYIRNIWPLLDKKLTRQGCLDWMSRNGFPIPPRSACVECPFHSDLEWRNLKENAPSDFNKAVGSERAFQAACKEQTVMKGTVFFHKSCVNLDEVDFGDVGSMEDQLGLFGNECEGMCGV